MNGLVLILRPQPGADETAARARALGLDPVVAPLFTVRPLAWQAPNPADFDAVMLTSANAARFGGDALTPFLGLPCYCGGRSDDRSGARSRFPRHQDRPRRRRGAGRDDAGGGSPSRLPPLRRGSTRPGPCRLPHGRYASLSGRREHPPVAAGRGGLGGGRSGSAPFASRRVALLAALRHRTRTGPARRDQCRPPPRRRARDGSRFRSPNCRATKPCWSLPQSCARLRPNE